MAYSKNAMNALNISRNELFKRNEIL